MSDTHEHETVPDRVALHGPYKDCLVTVDGWTIPFLEAAPVNGGIIDLVLDRRYGLALSVMDAERIIPFIADAIAIALGYTCHPRADWDVPRRRYEMSRLRSLYFEGTQL